MITCYPINISLVLLSLFTQSWFHNLILRCDSFLFLCVKALNVACSSFPVPRSYCRLEIPHLFCVYHGDPQFARLSRESSEDCISWRHWGDYLSNEVAWRSQGYSALWMQGSCLSCCEFRLVSITRSCTDYLSCNPSNRTWLTPSKWSHVNHAYYLLLLYLFYS